MESSLQERYGHELSQMKKTELVDLLMALLKEDESSRKFVHNHLNSKIAAKSDNIESEISKHHTKKNVQKKNSVFDMSR
jgi:hypothetical protein